VRGAGCFRKGTTCLGANADDLIGTLRIRWCQHDSMRATTLSKARIWRERYTNIYAWKETYVNKCTYMKDRLFVDDDIVRGSYMARTVYECTSKKYYVNKLTCIQRDWLFAVDGIVRGSQRECGANGVYMYMYEKRLVCMKQRPIKRTTYLLSSPMVLYTYYSGRHGGLVANYWKKKTKGKNVLTCSLLYFTFLGQKQTCDCGSPDHEVKTYNR